MTNPPTWSSVNPPIWSSVSQHLLTSFPASCLPVATIWHLGSNLSSINSEKIDNLLDGYSSNPSNINKMIFLFDFFIDFLRGQKLIINGFPNIRMHFSTFRQQYFFECCGTTQQNIWTLGYNVLLIKPNVFLSRNITLNSYTRSVKLRSGYWNESYPRSQALLCSS